MTSSTITLINALGLHARASAKLVECASRHLSTTTLHCKGKKADAKRILGVMSLGAKQGDSLDIVVEGDDEQTAIAQITQLINDRFGEDQ